MTIQTESRVSKLVVEDGRVVGVVTQQESGSVLGVNHTTRVAFSGFSFASFGSDAAAQALVEEVVDWMGARLDCAWRTRSTSCANVVSSAVAIVSTRSAPC